MFKMERMNGGGGGGGSSNDLCYYHHISVRRTYYTNVCKYCHLMCIVIGQARHLNMASVLSPN